jgi:hypothetical protein
LLSQDAVNELVGNAKAKGYQKGYQEALDTLKPTAPAQSVQQPSVQNNASGDVTDIVRREFTRLQQEDASRRVREQQEADGKRILGELQTKVTAAQQKYPDFDDVTKHVDFTQVPEVLHYANLVDNAGDVLYDLAKNPSHIGTLRSLPPALAAQEVRKLSDSIKANENAVANMPNAREPRSQIKSSPVQTTSDGNMSVRDFRVALKNKRY